MTHAECATLRPRSSSNSRLRTSSPSSVDNVAHEGAAVPRGYGTLVRSSSFVVVRSPSEEVRKDVSESRFPSTLRRRRRRRRLPADWALKSPRVIIMISVAVVVSCFFRSFCTTSPVVLELLHTAHRKRSFFFFVLLPFVFPIEETSREMVGRAEATTAFCSRKSTSHSRGKLIEMAGGRRRMQFRSS